MPNDAITADDRDRIADYLSKPAPERTVSDLMPDREESSEEP